MARTAASRLISLSDDEGLPESDEGVVPVEPARAPGGRRFPRAASLLLVLSVAVLLWGRGLGDESAVWVRADTPRYLLNGVFLTDFLRDHPLDAPMAYARRYFARYPGLSLGHHPVLTPILEVPFLAIFGVSVWSGRLSILCTLGVMLLFWFRLMERHYDTPTALFSSLLLASAPSVVAMSQQVESEPLALCFVVLALFFLQRYCDSERLGDGVAFIMAVVLGVYAKQLTVMVFPVYVLQFARTFGFRRLLSRRVLVATGVIGACTLPVVPLTLKYSHFNVQLVTQFISAENRVAGRTLIRLARAVTLSQVALPVLVMALVATVAAVMRRDWSAMLFLFWLASVYVGLAAFGLSSGRYACYSVPALCGLAASVMHEGGTARLRKVWMGILIVAFGHQALVSAQIRPHGGGGYEEAARFVSEQRIGDSVLYCATEDSGFFVFFVRKHDPRREMIVLRADKLLTTSRMSRSDFERRIQRPDEIAPILKQFGVGYVVIEDRPTPDGPLEWLRQMVHGDRFTLRKRIPITTSEARLRDVPLSIYEYKDRTPADPGARLSMKIPLMDDTIAVTFRDLLRHEAPR